MKPITLHQNSLAIVYDDSVFPAAGAELFEPGHWRARDMLAGSAPGRGTAWFINSDAGELVLRRYYRGGQVARLSKDRYWFTGFESSRPLREFDLLLRMREAGLNVPEPVAALCHRRGLLYTGALITRRIPGASALPDWFGDPRMDWKHLGKALREFHDAGMDHADLNARNILVQAPHRVVWLLDLDRSQFDPGKPVNGQANLARLKRSLDKLWPSDLPALAASWDRLLEGYNG